MTKQLIDKSIAANEAPQIVAVPPTGGRVATQSRVASDETAGLKGGWVATQKRDSS